MRRIVTTLLATCALLAGAAPALASEGRAVPDISTPTAESVDPGTGTRYESDRVVVPMYFPVAGPVRYSDNWLACRSGCVRKHMGQDLMSAKMTPLIAAFDDVVTSLKRETAGTNAGNYLTIAGDRRGSAGWAAVYVHVNNDTPGTDDGRGTQQWSFPSGLEVGSRVLAGQLVGWVGDSGNAESTGPHLHFELHHGTGWGGVVYNAYPSLQAARPLARPLPSGPHPAGTLVRHPNGSILQLDGGAKRPVSAAVLRAQRRTSADAVPITAAESLGYPTLTPQLLPDGVVVRDPRGTTWLVSKGTRAKAYMSALAALGRRTPSIVNVGDDDLQRLPVVAMPQSPLYPGALVRPVGGSAVSFLDRSGTMRPLRHPVEMQGNGWAWQDIADLPADAMTQARTGAPIGLRDGTLVQTSSRMVAVVSGGYARRLYDTRQVRDYGYTGLRRLPVPDALLAGLPQRALSHH